MSNVTRRSIDVPGLGHGQLPIPVASRVGPFIATGGVRGVDPSTGVMSADPREQVARMFHNLKTVVEAAGGSVDTVLKVTIFIKAPEVRALLDLEWVMYFPDPANRPARHVLNYEGLGGGMVVQCEALAIAPHSRSLT